MKNPLSKFSRKIGIVFRRKLGPTVISSNDNLGYLRERIFHYLSLGILLFGTILFYYFVRIFFKAGQTHFVVFSTFVYLLSVFIATVRSLSIKFRIGWTLFVIYIVGIFTFINSGNPVLGMVFLLTFSMLSGVLAGQLGAFISVLINAFSLVGLGFIFYFDGLSGILLHPMSYDRYLNVGIAFMMANLLCIIPLTAMLNGLAFNMHKERRYQKILQKEHRDLEASKIKAEESDRLKTAFLSNMSHEIRTPMNAILGFSNLLSHPDVDEERKQEFVNLITSNGKSLLTLVEDIIDISKIESGQLYIKNGPCHLHSILHDVYESFYDDIQRRDQSRIQLYLKEGIKDENLMILTDGYRLKQVITNLVGNAVKFTEFGFVEFGYEVQDTVLRFYVKDTGVGLPKGKEHEIFNRFSKFGIETNRLYGGTGIGLCIAKHLVEMLGGNIGVESKSLVGTTFYFTIPFHRIGIRLKNDMVIKRHQANYNWEGKTFLVAEDEEDNFRYIEVVLALSNAKLLWARDGKEAVEMFRNEAIDLVLMDIKMPFMDGYAATQEIKQIRKSVPIIAQSAYSMGEEQEKSVAAGCDDYLAKPISYDDLLRTIHRYVPSC